MAFRARIIAATVTVLALALLAAPLTRDWSGEVARLSARAQHSLGLEVILGGQPRLTLLPPALTVDQVRLGRDGAELARIERVSLRLTLGTLLGAEVAPSTVVAERLTVAGRTLDRIEARLAPDRVDGFTSLLGHAVTFAAALDRAANTLSLRVSAPTLSTGLRFEGSLETGAAGPVVAGHASLNSGHLGALLPGLALPPGIALRAEADLDLGDGQLTLVNLDLDSNGSRASGSVLVLAGSPALVEGDLEIDRLDLDAWRGGPSAVLPSLLPAALTPPAAISAGPTGAQAAAASILPGDVLANLRLAVGTLIWQGQSLTDLEIQAGLDQGTVVLRHAQAVVLRHAQTIVPGHAQTVTPGRGQAQAKPGDLRLDLDGTLQDKVFAGRLRLNGPGLSGRADLRATHDGLGPALELNDLHLNRDGTFVRGRLNGRWHDGVDAQWQGDIGAWQDTALSARLHPGADGLQADDLSLRLGDLSLRGQARLALGGPRPRVDAQLRGDVIDLNALAAPQSPPVPATAAAKPGRSGPAAAKTAPKPDKAASPFDGRPLDWSALNAVDGSLALSAAAIDGDWGRLDQPSLRIGLKDGIATLEQMHATFADGTLSAAGVVSGQAVPRFRLEATLKEASLARLRPALAGLSLDAGRLDARMRLESFGKSRRDMAANAQGEGLVTGEDGSVSGMDLVAIDRQLSHLDSIGNVLALAQTGLAGGRTPFSRLSGRLSVRDGVLRGPDLALNTPGGALHADLTLDLARWTTDTTLSLALASLPQAPLTLRLAGPVQAPRRVVDANTLQRVLVQSGLGRALGQGDGVKVSPRALRDLLRGKH